MPKIRRGARADNRLEPYIKTRAAVARARARDLEQPPKEVIVISDKDNETKTKSKNDPLADNVGKEEKMGDESGGLSGNKANAQEDASFPDRVIIMPPSSFLLPFF